jgi:NADH:ubiquinone oxidoreductase subunit D
MIFARSIRIWIIKNYDFDVPIGSVGDSYDRYLVRLEEINQSVGILRQVLAKLPPGPINWHDPKSTLPDKVAVLTKMEELIHHFIASPPKASTPPPGKSISGRKTPRANSDSTFTAKAAESPTA